MFLSTKNDGGVGVSKMHMLSNNIETMMGCNTNEIIENFHPDTSTNQVQMLNTVTLFLIMLKFIFH